MRYSPSSQHRKGWTLRASYVATLCAILSTMALSNCVRIPVADGLAKGPQVDEIVRRVKCDLYDALADRLNATYGYEWLHSWTVQANLNLIVTDQSLLSPGVVLTEPLKAVTIPQKVSNFGQSFNFGLGAGATNTATRNESITFTVSMDELMSQFGSYHRNCDFPNNIDLQSELGLREWVSAALSPVDDGNLAIGYHKSPKTGGSATSVTAAIKDVQAAMKEPASNAPPNGNHDCGDDINYSPPRNSGPPSVAATHSDIFVASCDISHITNKKEFDFSKLDGKQVKFIAQTVKDIQRVIADLMLARTPSNERVAAALEKTALALTVFVDPPIDTMSHQVQFIIVLNANASPSWTLLRFKGPSPSSGPLFSATITKTHTLNIVFGPPSSPDALNALSALQIGTAVGNAITSGAPPTP